MGDGICALLADSLEYSKERESTEELPVAKVKMGQCRSFLHKYFSEQHWVAPC